MNLKRRRKWNNGNGSIEAWGAEQIIPRDYAKWLTSNWIMIDSQAEHVFTYFDIRPKRPLPIPFIIKEKHRSLPSRKTIEIFNELSMQWKIESSFLSITEDKVLHPAYQQIIGLGAEAIPLILEELRNELGHWCWALKMITREDPVAAEDQGDVKKIADAWLQWGSMNNYIS